MKKICLAILCVLLVSSISFGSDQSKKKKPKLQIKIATLVPSGSYEKLNTAIKEATDYEVGLKFYYGGVQGDAKDVLRKIRFKQLHGATLSGYGLGQIVPESRVTNIPYMFRNHGEVTYVRQNLEAYMNRRFEEEGFQVLGWYDMGFVYTFSKVPITDIDVARQQKFWVPENDEVANALCQTLGITPVSLSITDVLTSLSTRLIDAAAAPPLAAVAFRWYTRFKYMTEYPLGNVVSAMVITKKEWDKISPENKAKIQSVAREFFLKAEDVIQEKNRKSIQLLKDAGIEVVRLEEAEHLDFIRTTSEKTQEALVGKMFSRELLDKTRALLENYRKAHPDSDFERIK